mgnify:FL=1
MKKFIFTRIVQVEEKYSVEMNDDMANETVAKGLLTRQLANDKFTTAVELCDSRVVKTGRVVICK